MDAAYGTRSNRSIVFEAKLPFVLGCVFLALLPFPRLGELPGGISMALVVMFACLPIWYIAACARQALVVDRTAAGGAGIVLACAGFLLLWSLLSAVDVDVPFRSGRYIATLVAAFAIYLMVIGTVTRRRLSIYIDVICFTLAFTSLVSFFGYYESHLRSMIFMGTDRASGFFKNPNQFGMALSTLFPVATAVLLGQRHRRLLRVACLALFLLGLVACGSKTNLMLASMTLVFMLCAFSIVAYSGRKRVFMILLSVVATAVLVAGVVVLMNFFNPRALRLMLEFFSQDGELHSLTTRNQIWEYSFQQFLANPIFGEGAGQPIDVIYRNETVPHSHNVLLDYLRTLGAPGFFGLLIILGTAAWMSVATIVAALRATRCDAQHRILCIGLAMGCLSYIAANMSSDSMGPSTSPFFWLVLYLGLAARSLLVPPAASRSAASPRPSRVPSLP